MLIAVANPKEGSGKSTCAVNLACALAGFDNRLTDRWQGKHSVVLVDADVEGTATRCCSFGHLPVSGDHGPNGDPKDIERWIQRMRAVIAEVDYIVVDGPSQMGTVLKAIVGISDLVIVPWSVSAVDSVTRMAMIELVREARLARGDSGPRCLLVPTRVNAGAAEKEIEIALNGFDEPVGAVIHQSAEFADAFNAGRWIGDFSPGSAADRDIKALTAGVEKIITEVSVGRGTVANSQIPST
jgi:chromosome partitioning protein